jgi:carboxypeptidase Q
MKHLRPAALVATFLAVPVLAAAPAAATPTQAQGIAWDIVADLTTEVGQRLGGTDREAAARMWAIARLKALGFANVHAEPFTMPAWIRGEEHARLTRPVPQNLAITALGNSAPTPATGIEADVVYFATLDALRGAPDGSLAGRIAFIDHALRPTQDGTGYGPFGNARRKGPSLAASKGALGVVIRSIGTDHHRNPHTGGTSFAKGVAAIPSGAVSNPDADLIARIAASGKTMRLAMTLLGHPAGDQPSGNVIGELPGRDPSLPPILLACHLDSWDLGTGAVDDGAGCAIITAAALQASQQGRLLRTVRVLWAGSEELGGFGGIAYGKAHAAEPHALAMESDFGADRVYRVLFGLAAANKPLADRIAAALGPLGVPQGQGKPEGGTDVEPIIVAQKPAVIDLNQDGMRYFDLHHTPDDTLDKIDPAQLQQNVDAWAVVVGIAGNEAGIISGAE